MTSDSALYYLLRKLLDAKTQTEAKAYIEEHVGDDYLKIASEVLGRITYHRTKNQNALLHKWFGQIAIHRGDTTASEVKGECHQMWALPIRLRDEQFNWVWQQTGAMMSPDRQVRFLASGVLCISSAMTTKELHEYMNEIEQHYRPKGVRLTEPEAA